jgi:hypothetical protein
MARVVSEQYGSAEIPPLTGQEKVVLQAIYDHFRAHGAWPTFIAIDRPIRRQHHWDTAAIILSLPGSLAVPPRQGMRPVPTDELRLRLLGVRACDGSSDDTERFVRTLCWLAEREETYEPPPGTGDEMPQVTSQEVAQFLGLDTDDPLPLRRLYMMLNLDHWGIGGSSSNENGWSVRLTPDIWHFREVRSVEDCVVAREAWLAEERPAIPKPNEVVHAYHYHVRLSVKEQRRRNRFWLDLTDEALESQILASYFEGHAIVGDDGLITRIEDITQIQIIRTEQPSGKLPRRSFTAEGFVYVGNDAWRGLVANGQDVTSEFIIAGPGRLTGDAIEQESPPSPAQVGLLYVHEKVIKAIHAKDGQSAFDVTKLIALVDELNDNYSRSNTYASHALLRAILDHIPPILGQPHFDAVANNYRWTKTDKKYVQQLAAFRAQGDDALHRQISANADLLGFDDMPKSVCVDQLLLECAKRL